MNKILRKFGAVVFALVFVFTVFPKTSVFAYADSYTVKFRAGNVNTFNVSVLKDLYNVEDANENYFTITVDKDDTLRTALAKVIIPAYDANEDSISNDQIDAFFSMVVNPNENYNLEKVSDWCDAISVTATGETSLSHNESYVLSYCKLVNPVKYTVYFLDTEDQSQIATPWIRFVNGSDASGKISVSPIAIAKYATTNTTVEIDLSKEGDHTVSFFYAYVGEYVHVPSGEEGEVIYNDIIREIVINAPVVDGQNQNNANNGGNNQNQDNQNGAGGGDEQPTDDNPNQGTNDINDEPTPQGPGETEINDDPVPMYHGGLDTDSPIKNVIFISSIAGVIALFAVIATLIIKNQRKHAKSLSDENSNSTKEDK